MAHRRPTAEPAPEVAAADVGLRLTALQFLRVPAIDPEPTDHPQVRFRHAWDRRGPHTHDESLVRLAALEALAAGYGLTDRYERMVAHLSAWGTR